MLGRRVWRGQAIEDAPLTRKHWRVREKREWRWEVASGDAEVIRQPTRT